MSDELIKISISVVAYNNYDDIKKMLLSMSKFTSSKLLKKVYIVDNGSSITEKNKKNQFLEFLKTINEFEYIDAGENLGFGKGHNLILDKINSEYHAIVNPDIIFLEDSFSSIVNWMDKEENVGMVIPNIVDERFERQNVYRNELTIFDMFIRMFCKGIFKSREKQHTLQYEDYSKPFPVPFGQGSFLVIRSNLFKKLNGFDDGYFMYLEDADLCKRVNQVSRLMYYPNTTVMHKWERGSHKNKKLFLYHISSMRYYFKKWGYKFF